MDNEEPFAEEAHEQADVSRRRTAGTNTAPKRLVDTYESENDGSDNEQSPLMGPDHEHPRRQSYARAGKSYQRAINEPWTGAHGAGGLPFYKKPSVSRETHLCVPF